MAISREEFEKLALEHLDMLYRLARRLTSDSAAAEDLVQETYLRALRAHSSFELQQYGIRPWLVRILHNLQITRSGRERRQPIAVDGEVLDSAAEKARHGLPLTPGSLEGLDDRLRRAIDELPPEYQTVLLLWALEEFSYKEIADALDIPIGTVMSRLHRARRRLARQLGTYARQEGLIRE